MKLYLFANRNLAMKSFYVIVNTLERCWLHETFDYDDLVLFACELAQEKLST